MRIDLQSLKLLLILLDPRITRTPLRVLKALRAKGTRRLPTEVQNRLEGGIGRVTTLGFIRSWLAGEMITRHDGQWVVNSFLPPFPGPAFDRMFENLLSGRRLSPVSANLAVTAECPCSCWHCSLKNRTKGNLTTDEWKQTLDQLVDLGVSIISFTGGEPLARLDIAELVAHASGRGATPIIFTCGTGFDEKTAAALRRSGLWAVCVSLDHPDPAVFNQGRGRDAAYDDATAAIKLARRAGFYTMTGVVASRKLFEGNAFERTYALARSLGVHEFRLVEPMPCGKLADASDDALLTPEHVAAIRAFHVDTNRKGLLPKVCSFNHVESPEYFGCGAGTQHLFVDTAGNVCPCDFTPLSFGNILREPLTAIWTRMNDSMGNPRRNCFIQKHHRLIMDRKGVNEFPLPPDLSTAICAEAGPEPLPDYFAMVTGQKGG